MSLPSPASPELAETAALFAALGDPTRLALVERLSTEHSLSIARLTAGSAVSRQAITKHLQVLADAGLVHGSRRGREHVWELDPERLSLAQQSLEQISRQWDEALGRLKRFVEE